MTMPHYISKSPMIAVIPPESQKERLDTFYYHYLFADLDDRLEAASKDLTPAENASILITDGTHQTPTYTEKENGVLFLSSTNIAEYGVDLSECKYIIPELHKRLKNCQPRPGDVLIAKSGTVGTACVFPEGLPECSVYESVAIFRPNEKWNPNYIVAFINSDLGIKQIQRSQKGIAIKHLHLGDLKELWFPKLDEEAQKILVSRIDSVANLYKRLTSKCNNLIQDEHEITREKIDLAFARELSLENFIQRKSALVFLRDFSSAERLDIPANHPDYTRLLRQIRQSDAACSLSDLVEVSEDRFNPDECIGQEINYLAIGDIDGISGNIIEPQKMLAEELPSRARRLIHAGDILVGTAGASTGTENMVVFPVTCEQEGWVATTGFLVLRPRDGVDIHYVCSLLKAPFVLRQIRALLTSPAMPTISDTDFMHLAVPVTSPDTREKTLNEINKVLKEERQLTIQLEQISEQIEQLLSEAKSNIFDLLDDDKFSAISARAMVIENTMGKIEEALQ